MLTTDIRIEGQALLGVPKEIVIKIANDICTHVALWGEADVKRQLYPTHGEVTSRLKRSVTGHLVKNLHAVIDTSTGSPHYAIYVEKGNGRGFHGYHMFAISTERAKKRDFSKVQRKIINRYMQ